MRMAQQEEPENYNIIPIHNLSLLHPEVHAATAALRAVGNLPKLPDEQWDLLDWLGLVFGFQKDNVRNQREHIVLHLANSQMQLTPSSHNIDTLNPIVLERFRDKLLQNYTNWCSYLNKESAVRIYDGRELLYISLYLLIWGESANLRFMPECICYIFHHMAMELNKLVEDYTDKNTEEQAMASFPGENAFLNSVVKPIYHTIKEEVERSKNGKAPHSAWRNYDDLNEYFWTQRCFEKLKWPIDVTSNFFAHLGKKNRVGKTGFVEQRTFWSLFRSFDRLWLVLILFLHVAIIVAWEETRYPWQALQIRDVQVRLLTVFFTWSCLRFLQSLLDATMQYPLISKETVGLGVRMVLKSLVAAGWIGVFEVFYGRIWNQKKGDGHWSEEANRRVESFFKLVLVFLLPELSAMVLFTFPWLNNFVENTNWRIFHLLSWWFQSRSFVGRAMSEGLADKIKYTIFWLVVLTTKLSFSYFLQISPMISPSKQLMNLKDVKYEWHELFKNNNYILVGLLWLPVVFIYLIDMQIWYAMYSSFLGATIGLFAHLGEIRNIQQLRLRFQFFASAFLFNLMPEKQLSNAWGISKSKSKDAIQRWKLRYGLGQPYKKLESNPEEANNFGLIWNEIIVTFREEDIISDRELELLELPLNSWNIRVIRWPCFLLCNELLHALTQAKELASAPDKWLWYKICSNEYRRCAVIEAYDSVKHLLLEIVNVNAEEHSIVTVFFQQIEHSVQIGKLTTTYNLASLLHLHKQLIVLLEALKKHKKDVGRLVNILQALYEIAVREFPRVKRSIVQLRKDGLAPCSAHADAGFLFENAVELPDDSDEFFYRQVGRLHTILVSRDSMENVPGNPEARRRLAFFSNSVFMNMPRAPHVEKMMAFSVLTPYFNEEVLYRKEYLRTENEDGISILYYLQTIYEDEWKNFLERMRREGIEDDDELGKNIRLWASYRGQTLARTVRGMMYYYRVLNMLSFLDSATDMDIRERARELGKLRQDGCSDSFDSFHSCLSGDDGFGSLSSSFKGLGVENGITMMKYTHVVACQIYGIQKANKDPCADEILYLMKQNKALRVAYVDELNTPRGEKEYYSVLVKYDEELDREVEVYRIKLPGPMKLGEGKPENQNHALIYTRGDAVQAIDMNQDNYFEEALKMRNLLEEFKHYHGIRMPSLLGVREHIFTGSVSSLAWFMSSQESSFVTLGHRVMANPLRIRMHYGHPDVFDRFWFLTRGGISKASRALNITEDIFAGFNCTLRGGSVTHHEYIQVGKGRDVGLNQISMFEAKIASGNGEQVLSRDVYRLGHRLDFFRMLSFFHSSVGFYFNNMMIILTVFAFLWCRLYFALSGVEASAMVDRNHKYNNNAVAAILNQQFVIQLGLFTALPVAFEGAIENDFLKSIWDFLKIQLQLSPIFYTLSLGTKTHFFGRTILHGGAKYQATGRGFVVQHKSFTENYRLYARSHFVKAIELGLIISVYESHSIVAKDSFFYIDLSISCWLLVLSWIMAPFIFNPSGFDWSKTVNDFNDFRSWIWYKGGKFTKPEQSWESWWYQEQEHLRTTGLWGKILEIALDLRFFFFQYGIVYKLAIANGSTSIAVYLLSWIYVVSVFLIYWIIAYARDKYAATKHFCYRMINLIILILVLLLIVALRLSTSFRFGDILTSLLILIPTGWGMLSIAQVFRPFLQPTPIWISVVSVARFYDIMLGMIVMSPMAILAWMPGFQSMQTRILFNQAFSMGLRIFQIITTRKSKFGC